MSDYGGGDDGYGGGNDVDFEYVHELYIYCWSASLAR
jgi:hypothetical protein